PRYGQDKDRIIIVKKVAYDELFDSLSIQVLSDQSPDMFEFTTKMFPYIAANKMVQPIDDVVDMSDPVWDGYRELSEMIKYNGKMYCPVIQYRVEDLWYYRKSVVKEAGLPDPAELFRKGEWDWDHMLGMAAAFQQTSTSDQKKYFVDGDYVQSSIMNSSGVPMIGMDDSGKAVNNMNDPRLESAARVLRELCEHEYRYPFEANGNRTNMKEWIMGNTLFFVHGDWFWEDINNQGISFQFTRGRLEPDDIGCVPAPKNPDLKDHPCNYDLFGYALCAGSDNYDSYNAWNQCNMIAHKDKKINEEDKKQRFENYQWTEEVWHMIWEEFEDPVVSPLTPVFDFAYGISEDGVHDTTGLTPMDMIMKKPYIDMKYSPYEVARDENNNIINTYIEKINSGITQ
ncbi:MAG: extracellular solute-binding protein, partial [Ruminiclostridium sp.]|nr:extracellular solute-binding protein [Ruminiclostridium sp.]